MSAPRDMFERATAAYERLARAAGGVSAALASDAVVVPWMDLERAIVAASDLGAWRPMDLRRTYALADLLCSNFAGRPGPDRTNQARAVAYTAAKAYAGHLWTRDGLGTCPPSDTAILAHAKRRVDELETAIRSLQPPTLSGLMMCEGDGAYTVGERMGDFRRLAADWKACGELLSAALVGQ